VRARFLSCYCRTRSMSLHRSKQWDPPDRRDESLASIVPPRTVPRLIMPAASCRQWSTPIPFLRWGAIRQVDHYWPCTTRWLAVALMAGNPLYGGGAWSTATCRRSCVLSTSPRRFICPSSISLIARLSGRAGRGGIRTGAAGRPSQSPRSTNHSSLVQRYHPQRIWCRGGAHRRTAANACAMPGHRQAGVRCLSAAASRPLSRRDRAAPTPRPGLRRSKRAQCATLAVSYRSEAFWVVEIIDPRDTRLSFANSPVSPRLAAPPAERVSPSGPSVRSLLI